MPAFMLYSEVAVFIKKHSARENCPVHVSRLLWVYDANINDEYAALPI